MYAHGVESFVMGMDDATFRDQISTEVSHILLEELPGIIGQITDKLIIKFDEQSPILRATREIFEVTREGNLDMETQSGKRRHAHDSE